MQGARCVARKLDGELCGGRAPYIFEGKPCCWTHLVSADSGPRQRREEIERQQSRLEPVKFSKRRTKDG